MAKFYADEQFPHPTVKLLRNLGHDVLTVQEAGNANQEIPDDEVLAFATKNQRAVLTGNRRDYIRLHNLQPTHAGIIICTEDTNFERLVARIHEAIFSEENLTGKLVRVVRPST